MIYPLVRGALFLLDPEWAHEFTVGQMERLQRIDIVRRLLEKTCAVPASPVELWGLRFPNRIGIAAGFDKNGRLVPFLQALGFGFVEVGTVTLREQPGNARPRLFRIPESRALINRLGFNNEGAVKVARRLRELPRGIRHAVPLLVNIGKNRDVGLDQAGRHYEDAYRILAPAADGVVVNVSSPNTPGLRDLQEPEQIREILTRMLPLREEIRGKLGGMHPILVKIAPDLTVEQIARLAAVCGELADGMIATNTTTSREGLRRDPHQAGGLSGRPLFERSTAVLRQLRAELGKAYPLIGVGGVFSAADAIEKLDAGADLVQAYTGFIYEGPGFASRIGRTKEVREFTRRPEQGSGLQESGA